ncbi:fluoride efflux transporter CrcB [Metabacillus idriensis]|uniref:fluoride efflux transporter CrcB n=1 Tax=Metabacillus idriensis TaxID=324768 RepID=UPI00174D2BCA|nr:fluoride efflux transporter CrcB [Metabacillus idriensis]
MIAVIIGGAIGTFFRFVFGEWLKERTVNAPFPMAIIIINIFGSFGLGLTVSIISTDSSVCLFLATGFFGAFTTFSAFSMEAFDLIKKRAFMKAGLYLFLTAAGTVIAFWAGRHL